MKSYLINYMLMFFVFTAYPSIWASTLNSLSLLMLPSVGHATSTPPVRQVRNAIHELSKTTMGRDLLTPFDRQEYGPLYELLNFESISNNHLFFIQFDYKDQRILFNQHLMEASPAYNSWVLAQALAHYKIYLIAEKYSIYDFPYFKEIALYEMILASKHWAQLGSPNEEDYYYDPDKNFNWFPRQNDSSVSKFDKLWRSDREHFKSHTLHRHEKLKNTTESIYQAVQSAQGTRKIAYEAIIKELESN